MITKMDKHDVLDAYDDTEGNPKRSTAAVNGREAWPAQTPCPWSKVAAGRALTANPIFWGKRQTH
jgi:hypothetical protein